MKPGRRLRPCADVMLNHVNCMLWSFSSSQGARLSLEKAFSSLSWEAEQAAVCWVCPCPVSQDLTEAPHGLPKDAEWLGQEIPKALWQSTRVSKQAVVTVTGWLKVMCGDGRTWAAPLRCEFKPGWLQPPEKQFWMKSAPSHLQGRSFALQPCFSVFLYLFRLCLQAPESSLQESAREGVTD